MQRYFEWAIWPKEDRADQVLEGENLALFEIRGREEQQYSLPYPHLQLLEELSLYSHHFEFRCQQQLACQYKP
jgi:hypothetical protein